MTIPDQILADQNAALAVIRRIAESLPGFTFVENGDQEDTESGSDAV